VVCNFDQKWLGWKVVWRLDLSTAHSSYLVGSNSPTSEPHTATKNSNASSTNFKVKEASRGRRRKPQTEKLEAESQERKKRKNAGVDDVDIMILSNTEQGQATKGMSDNPRTKSKAIIPDISTNPASPGKSNKATSFESST